MYWRIIFYRTDPPAVSPEVNLDWRGKIVDLLNRLPADVWFNDNGPDRQCVDFIAASYADTKIGPPSGIWSVPLQWEQAHGTPMSGEPWRQWLFEEIERLSANAYGEPLLPVLIGLDPPYHVTQGDKGLCRRLREDEYKPGKPLWTTAAESKNRYDAATSGNRPRRTSRSNKRRGDPGVPWTIIFYRSDLNAISPAVRVRWPGKVIDLFNRLKPILGDDQCRGWIGGGNAPDAWRVDFVASCCAMPEIGASRVELHNLPLRWDQFNEPFDEQDFPHGTPEYDEAWHKAEEAWRKRLFKEIRRVFAHDSAGEELPVLVNTYLPSQAVQGGKPLFRMLNMDEYEPDGPIWVEAGKRVRARRNPLRPVAVETSARPAKPTPDVPLTLYASYTIEQAVAAFGDPSTATFYCDRQFAVVRKSTLCFATMGDPDAGTKVHSPSLVVWKPGRLDYHPKSREPWFPSQLTKCIERNGGYVPLHHMFLRAAGDEQFVYAGIAEMPMFGEIPEDGRIQHAAHFYLDAKLPRELWVRLGRYSGWLVGFNNTKRLFGARDVAGFEKLLADIPTTSGHWQVTLTGYEEWCLTIEFNATRAHLSYRPLYWPLKMGEERCVESYDPDCPTPKKEEFFGAGVVVPGARTVPRQQGIRAAVEHFRTARLPECIRWREAKPRC